MIWAQRGDSNFHQLLAALSVEIWGEPREIAGDTILAILRGDLIVGIVAFHNFDSHNGTIEISASGDTGWLSRRTLKEVFGYVFTDCGCQAAVMRCDPEDKVMERISKAYGFTQHLVPHLRGANKSEAVYVLSKNDWRRNGFHKENAHGQVRTRSYAA